MVGYTKLKMAQHCDAIIQHHPPIMHHQPIILDLRQMSAMILWCCHLVDDSCTTVQQSHTRVYTSHWQETSCISIGREDLIVITRWRCGPPTQKPLRCTTLLLLGHIHHIMCEQQWILVSEWMEYHSCLIFCLKIHFGPDIRRAVAIYTRNFCLVFPAIRRHLPGE